MRNIKMIATDLDGTLLRNDKTISEYTRSVLKRCIDKGIILSVATGRSERRAMKHATIGLVSYIIADNGATVATFNKELRRTEIPDASRDELLARLAFHPEIRMISVDTGQRNYVNFPFEEDPVMPWNSVIWDFKNPMPESVRKISAECGDPGAIRAIMRDYPDLRLFTNSGELWYQITHASVSKYSGIAYLAKITGIDTSNVIAFGDDFNDIEMLQNCGFGVAMGNADNSVKRNAGYICGINEEDGMAKYLDEHLLKVI